MTLYSPTHTRNFLLDTARAKRAHKLTRVGQPALDGCEGQLRQLLTRIAPEPPRCLINISAVKAYLQAQGVKRPRPEHYIAAEIHLRAHCAGLVQQAPSKGETL